MGEFIGWLSESLRLCHHVGSDTSTLYRLKGHFIILPPTSSLTSGFFTFIFLCRQRIRKFSQSNANQFLPVFVKKKGEKKKNLFCASILVELIKVFVGQQENANADKNQCTLPPKPQTLASRFGSFREHSHRHNSVIHSVPMTLMLHMVEKRA